MLLLAVVAMGVASFTGMALPVFTGELVGAVTTDKGFSDECKQTPTELAECRRQRLTFVLLVMGCAFAVSGLSLALSFWLFRLAGERLVSRLRQRLFTSYLQQDIAFFDEQTTGELMNRLASDCTTLQDTLTRTLGEGMHNLIQTAVGLVLMSIASPLLTLITLGAVPLIGVFALLYGLFVQRISERYQAALASASEVAQETLSSIRTVRSFAMEEAEQRRYGLSVRRSFALGSRKAAAFGAFIGLVASTAQFALVVVLWYGCNRVIDGDLDFGQLTSFLLVALYTVAGLGGFFELFSAVMSALGSSRRIFELLDTLPTLPLEGGSTLSAVRGELCLEAVAFAYPSRPDVVVLKALSISVAPGQALALCGQSGGGKSTVIALLERWYDPTEGRITIDGVPLASLDASWWRRQVALVAQEPVLFNCSVLDNLRYARKEASAAQAEQAALTANAHAFISSFSEGYETVVGERGVKLSGGQKQRIAIARALIAEPKVLLLDEATSALDAESEALVQQAIDQLMVGRTAVVVAHRLSTIRRADCICVIEGGLVAEAGTHDELMRRKGSYARLGRRQMNASDGE